MVAESTYFLAEVGYNYMGRQPQSKGLVDTKVVSKSEAEETLGFPLAVGDLRALQAGI